MSSRLTQTIVMAVCSLLMAVYLLLNLQKVTSLTSDWADISAGVPAHKVQLFLAEELVHHQALKSSEIFDAAGVRQIYFIALSKSLFNRVQTDISLAKLVIDDQEVTVGKTGDESALLAVTKGKRVYLLRKGELKYLLTVIWNETARMQKLLQCVPASLCASLRVTSNSWGPLQGPFLNSDVSSTRRSMPRGRWVTGPRASIEVQSSKAQKIWLQINLLSAFPDQQLALRGTSTPLQKVGESLEPIEAGGRLFYPGVYVIPLNLQAGANRLDMAFSKWDEAAGNGANPLAAYFTAIGLRQAP